MEEFLRKKLGEVNDSADGWDRPDAVVWESVQEQLAVEVPPKRKRKFLTWFFLFLGLGALIATYFWSLKKQINKLESVNTSQVAEIEKTTNALNELTEKHTITNQQLTTAKQQLEAANINLNEKENQLKNCEKLVTVNKNRVQQNNIIDKRELVTTPVLAEALIATPIPIQKRKEDTLIEDEIETAQVSNAKYFSTLFTLAKKEIPLLDVSLTERYDKYRELKRVLCTKEPWQKIKRFELGYIYSRSTFQMPTKLDFGIAEGFSKETKQFENNLHTHGVHFAFSPIRNLYLTSGFKRGVVNATQNYSDAFYYEDRKTYDNLDGTKGNDLEFNSTNPYFEGNSILKMEIPADSDLERGDLIDIEFSESQRIRYAQVPLGLQYFLGRKRLQLQFNAGLIWNQMTFDNYELKTDLNFEDETLKVKEIEYLSKPGFKKKFIMTYVGTGIDFRLFKDWHLRGGINFNINTLSKKIEDFKDTKLNNQAIDLGLIYRF